MIWLLAPPPPPLPSAISTTHRKTEKKRQLTNGKGARVVGEKPNHTTARQPGPLEIYSILSGFMVALSLCGAPVGFSPFFNNFREKYVIPVLGR